MSNNTVCDNCAATEHTYLTLKRDYDKINGHVLQEVAARVHKIRQDEIRRLNVDFHRVLQSSFSEADRARQALRQCVHDKERVQTYYTNQIEHLERKAASYSNAWATELSARKACEAELTMIYAVSRWTVLRRLITGKWKF